MSAIGDLIIWQHVPATQTSTLVTCILFNMKFVLASTLPTDRGWCNYLCSPCLVVGWFPFDAPSAQWPFGGALRREPVLAWCTWKGPSLRRCYAHIWHPHSLSSTLSLLVQPSTGVPKDAVSMWHLFKFCGPWGFPISSSSRKWSPSRRCMEVSFWVCLVDNHLLLLNFFQETWGPKRRTYLASELAWHFVLLSFLHPKLPKTRCWCGVCLSIVGHVSLSLSKWPTYHYVAIVLLLHENLSSQILGDLKEFDKDNIELSHLRWTCVNWI